MLEPGVPPSLEEIEKGTTTSVEKQAVWVLNESKVNITLHPYDEYGMGELSQDGPGDTGVTSLGRDTSDFWPKFAKEVQCGVLAGDWMQIHTPNETASVAQCNCTKMTQNVTPGYRVLDQICLPMGFDGIATVSCDEKVCHITVNGTVPTPKGV
jgi:hypothetical protein